jgi:pseudaminic acid synthase
MTIDCKNDYFHMTKDTPWKGFYLYDLYEAAYTPWDWYPKLQKVADSLGLDLFSTPFDTTAVDFLEEMDVPMYKVASFEIVDFPLLRYIARTGKPIILSTGMAFRSEISDAINTIHNENYEQYASNTRISLLKCTSAYPANPEDMNLCTIPFLAQRFSAPVGLSDHTLELAVPIVAVALGATIIEKHLTLSRQFFTLDRDFSLEPDEFKRMVDAVRITEKSLGGVRYAPTSSEQSSLAFRRSLFVVKDTFVGEVFTHDNVRSIRPGDGLSPKYLEKVIGRLASKNITRGTPLSWNLIA